MLALVLSAVVFAGAPSALDAVVLVTQGSAVCAGAVIDAQGTVVTSYHCVAGGRRPRVTLRDGRTGVARVERASVADDLAVLAVPDLAGAPWLELAEQAPTRGTTVWVLGHPFGSEAPGGFLRGTLRWSVTEGIVSASGPVALQVDAAINQGNSGGAIIDADGRLVAVVSRRLAADGIGFGTRVERVQDLLDGAPRGYGALGGTWSVRVLGGAYMGYAGGLSAGADLDVVIRDRVGVGIGVALPTSARWDAVRFGRAEHEVAIARVLLRQRLAPTPWNVWVDGFGGIAAVSALESDGAMRLSRSWTAAPVVGGALGLSNLVIEAGVAWADEPTVRARVMVSWPGKLGVF